mmetsp:Transcript_4547/g.18531  ORF Transcript_4547/g.18531 Transcript_4547/m.18531 type:complete len:223 (+) Transcript_4547:699-1367(+)
MTEKGSWPWGSRSYPVISLASAKARRQSLAIGSVGSSGSGSRFAACARRDMETAAALPSSLTVARRKRGRAERMIMSHSSSVAKPSKTEMFAAGNVAGDERNRCVAGMRRPSAGSSKNRGSSGSVSFAEAADDGGLCGPREPEVGVVAAQVRLRSCSEKPDLAFCSALTAPLSAAAGRASLASTQSKKSSRAAACDNTTSTPSTGCPAASKSSQFLAQLRRM